MKIEFNPRELERLARDTVRASIAEAQPQLDAVYRRSGGKTVDQIERMLSHALAHTSTDWNQDAITAWARQMAAGTPVKLSA